MVELVYYKGYTFHILLHNTLFPWLKLLMADLPRMLKLVVDKFFFLNLPLNHLKKRGNYFPHAKISYLNSCILFTSSQFFTLNSNFSPVLKSITLRTFGKSPYGILYHLKKKGEKLREINSNCLIYTTYLICPMTIIAA